jgi:hypothetical protein
LPLHNPRFRQYLERGKARIERTHGILKNKLDLRAHGSQLLFAERCKILSSKPDFPGGWPLQTCDAPCQSALTRA